jgi:hypothetical protein
MRKLPPKPTVAETAMLIKDVIFDTPEVIEKFHQLTQHQLVRAYGKAGAEAILTNLDREGRSNTPFDKFYVNVYWQTYSYMVTQAMAAAVPDSLLDPEG